MQLSVLSLYTSNVLLSLNRSTKLSYWIIDSKKIDIHDTKNLGIDIIAGTSIGAVNAAMIVGSKNDHPEKDLEDFWMELAESNPTIIPDVFVLDYDSKSKKYISKKISAAYANAAMFGVPKMFTPVWWRWLPWSHNDD